MLLATFFHYFVIQVLSFNPQTKPDLHSYSFMFKIHIDPSLCDNAIYIQRVYKFAYTFFDIVDAEQLKWITENLQSFLIVYWTLYPYNNSKHDDAVKKIIWGSVVCL